MTAARLDEVEVATGLDVAATSAATNAAENFVPFVLADSTGTMRASGIRRVMPASSWQSLPAQASSFLARAATKNEAAIIVGLIPFDHRMPAYLFQPNDVEWSVPYYPSTVTDYDTSATIATRFVAEPSRSAYAESVSRALEYIRSGDDDLRKVVLSRTLLVHSSQTLDPRDVLQRLRSDRSVTVFSVALPSEANGARRTFVGATPELLIEKSGRQIFSRPLAGSTRRRASVTEDHEAGDMLMHSAKDRREHAVVAESIADTLAPYCKELHVPRVPSLVTTASMWHLGTRIEGTLKSDDVSSLELATALHPTPAVCGTPIERAREVISELETFDRGFFAGAVGSCDVRGNGRWFVSIRCAELSGSTARLYAGAGIVAGSDADGEVAETAAKFGPMLRALRITAEAV